MHLLCQCLLVVKSEKSVGGVLEYPRVHLFTEDLVELTHHRQEDASPVLPSTWQWAIFGREQYGLAHLTIYSEFCDRHACALYFFSSEPIGVIDCSIE